MANVHNIPVSASLIESLSGVIQKPDAWTNGKRVTIRRWSAYRSMGYKTEYSAIPVEYVELRIVGERPRCWQYSGHRLPTSQKHFDGMKNDLSPYMVDVS